MSNIKLTIGHPRLIHKDLIAVLADLQSTVIFKIDGTMIGWVHEHSKVITFAEGYTDLYNALYNESDLAPLLIHGNYTRAHFKINGTISHREWDMETMFFLPAHALCPRYNSNRKHILNTPTSNILYTAYGITLHFIKHTNT